MTTLLRSIPIVHLLVSLKETKQQILTIVGVLDPKTSHATVMALVDLCGHH